MSQPQDLTPADLDQVAAGTIGSAGGGKVIMQDIHFTKSSARSGDADVDLSDLNNVRNNFGATGG